MCGICGIVYSDQNREVPEKLLTSMRDVLLHRGPDDSGNYLAPGIALGSRRLAVLDLSKNGHMPMPSSDGRYWITYNGEVYNYEELRSFLKIRGYHFKSNTDTEVLLYLFIEEGPQMLKRLNGMFALAIWDTIDRSLFVVRDRLGVKPLYYTHSDKALFFASEEKALFAAGVAAEFDQDKWQELLCFRYVAGEETPFLGVKRLLPGHYFVWRGGKLKVTQWWNLSEQAQLKIERQPGDSSAWFSETFDSSVGLRKISDVPVGVLLSGGLDSSSVAASLALQSDSDISSFTVRFSERDYDEGPLARTVADKFQLNQHELYVPTTGLLEKLEEASWLNDEPLAHGNDLHLLAISKYAKQKVTVLLSGEGADETLGGYVRYRPLQHAALLRLGRGVVPRLPQNFLRTHRLQKLGRFLSLKGIDQFVLFNACDLLPDELDVFLTPSSSNLTYRQNILTEAKSLYPEEPMRQAMYNDHRTFLCSLLDRNDRMTMGASIECRVPFLDYRLVEGIAAMPTNRLLSKRQSKALLRRAVGDRLPAAILKGKKWGFGIPWYRYYREVPELADLVRKLPENEVIRHGPFVTSKLKTIVADFMVGDNSREPLIRQLVMITIWHQSYFSKLRSLRSNLNVR